MWGGLEYLREMNVISILLRLVLAMLFGGFIGLERERKRRPAGFRTYMLVCLGAALTMLLSQYESFMVTTAWRETAAEIGLRTDVSRFGAQVINGIGFLGAGTIIVTGKQEVKGLTTAAGLWASACMGLAIGAGFYECVLLGFVLIFLTNRLLPFVEEAIIENARNMNIYVEFQTLDDLGDIIGRIKSQGVQIYEIDLDRGREERSKNPSAVFSIRLPSRHLHVRVLAAISELESVMAVRGKREPGQRMEDWEQPFVDWAAGQWAAVVPLVKEIRAAREAAAQTDCPF